MLIYNLVMKTDLLCLEMRFVGKLAAFLDITETKSVSYSASSDDL